MNERVSATGTEVAKLGGPGSWRRRLLVGGCAGALLAAVGCTASLGDVSVLGAPGSDWPVMVLSPDRAGRACATDGIFGLIAPSRDRKLLEAALADALADVDDANTLAGVTVELETANLLLVRRRCIRVQGDAAKRIRSLHVH